MYYFFIAPLYLYTHIRNARSVNTADTSNITGSFTGLCARRGKLPAGVRRRCTWIHNNNNSITACVFRASSAREIGLFFTIGPQVYIYIYIYTGAVRSRTASQPAGYTNRRRLYFIYYLSVRAGPGANGPN